MFGYNYGQMMDWNSGAGFFGFLFPLVILIDLVLLGAWLWKKVSEK